MSVVLRCVPYGWIAFDEYPLGVLGRHMAAEAIIEAFAFPVVGGAGVGAVCREQRPSPAFTPGGIVGEAVVTVSYHHKPNTNVPGPLGVTSGFGAFFDAPDFLNQHLSLIHI